MAAVLMLIGLTLLMLFSSVMSRHKHVINFSSLSLTPPTSVSLVVHQTERQGERERGRKDGMVFCTRPMKDG